MQVVDQTAAVLSTLGALACVALDQRLEMFYSISRRRTMSRTWGNSLTYPMFPIVVWGEVNLISNPATKATTGN
jgi:hypothetical protein